MFNLKNLKFGTKILLLGIGSVLITILALVATVIWQSGQFNALAQDQFGQLTDADLSHITEGVYNMVKAQDEAVQQQVNSSLHVAELIVHNGGDVRLAEEKIDWSATNEITQQALNIQLPKMYVGSTWLGQVTGQYDTAPIIDKVQLIVGGTTTIFQRMNEQGDMLRVATNVLLPTGKRAIGTFTPAIKSDGSADPVIAAILRGSVYRGSTFVVDAWYDTAYEPLRDATGQVIGMVFVGIKQQSVESIRSAILRTQIGQTGYVYVLGSDGADQGRYLISQDGQRDGASIWNQQDAEGNYVIRPIVETALNLKFGETASVRYQWQNLKDLAPSWKIASVTYYEPWHWIIVATKDESEIQANRLILENGQTRMIAVAGAAGIALALLAGFLSILLARSIARPVTNLVDIARQVTAGNLRVAATVESKDEIGTLALAFNSMTAQLRGMIGSLEQRVGVRTAQLSVSAEVSRSLTSILDSNTLIDQVVQLITDRFNFYYAAIFLIDDAGQNAVLRAATGEAGQTLKERGHKLEIGGQSMVSLAITTRRPRIALDADAESMRFANPLLTETKSEIALPLVIGLQSLGALDVQSTLVGAFDEGTVTVLQGLADQIAIALNNAHQYQSAQTDARQTRALYEASRLSSSISEELSTATEKLFRTICEQVGFDAWLAVTYDQEQAAYTVLTSYDSISRQHSLISSELVPVNRQPQTLLAQTILTQRPIIIADAQHDPRLANLPDFVRQTMGGMICVPALIGDQVVGAISLSRGANSIPISDRDVQLAETIATQLAVAIENRRLFEGARAAADELNQLMQLYTHQGWAQFTQLHAAEELHHEYRAPDVKPLDEHVIHQIEEAIAAKDPKPIEVDGDRIIGVPITLRGEVLGTIGVQDNLDRQWTTDEFATLQAVADQVAQSIEAARLLEDSEINLQETTELYRAGQAITAAQTHNDILNAFVDHIITPQLDRCLLVLIVPDSPLNDPEAEIMAAWSRNSLEPIEQGQKWKVSEVAYLTHEPNIISDVAALPTSDERGHSLLQASGVRAAANIPLLAGSQPIGWIVIQSHTDRYDFSERELRQYRALAAQAATALENRRLFEDVEARVNELSVLTRIGRRIASTLDLNEVLSLIVEETINVTNATHASLALYNETENALEVRVMRGFTPGTETSTLGLLIRPGQGLHGRLLVTGQSVLVNDVRTDPDYMDVNSDTRSEFIAPIRQGDLLLGALNLESPVVNALTDADQRLIEALADQAAVAIANARSYEAERQAVERMREVDRLKTQFLANMSHELRTPLNSIIGFSRVIMRGIDGPLTELQTTDLQSIYNSGQHLLSLINNILDLSKIEAGKMELASELIDLREIARSVMSTAIALVKDKLVKLEQEIPDNLPTVTADPTRVRQIMLNLISNASKFTEHGKITLRIAVNEQEAQISVSDTGMGIPADKLDHIFEEFTQVDASTTRRVGGTGLGLAITRRFVEMHGGRIWVESQLGVGSTFTFTLPLNQLNQPEEQPGITLPTDLAARDAGKKVILSIDDDPGVITLYKRYLEKQGYLVIGLTDPGKAVEEVKRLLPFAITLDIMMPNRDGWSLLADLKSTPEISRVPIVVCSIIQDKTKGYSLGATEYLVKPITEDELLHALDRVSRHTEIKRVLVIDDEPGAIQLIKRFMEARGAFDILEAAGGAQGITRVKEDQPDLIILDLMMPDVDGFAVLDTIKGDPATRNIPVIIVTAKEITLEDRDRLDGHAIALFNKGMFTADQLLSELAGALKQLTGMDVPNSAEK